MPKLNIMKEKMCAAYDKGKLTKSRSSRSNASQSPFLFICYTWTYVDLSALQVWELMNSPDIPTWTLFLRHKSDASEEINHFIKKSEVLNGKQVKSVRSDNDTEFRNYVLEDFFNRCLDAFSWMPR